MSKYGLVVIVFFGLVACGESTNTHGDNIENNKSISAPIETGKDKGSRTTSLDLSIPPDQEIILEENGNISETNSSPNMFNLEKKEDNISFGGNVIRDEENLEYVDSIEGAEVSIEMKLP